VLSDETMLPEECRVSNVVRPGHRRMVVQRRSCVGSRPRERERGERREKRGERREKREERREKKQRERKRGKGTLGTKVDLRHVVAAAAAATAASAADGGGDDGTSTEITRTTVTKRNEDFDKQQEGGRNDGTVTIVMGRGEVGGRSGTSGPLTSLSEPAA